MPRNCDYDDAGNVSETHEHKGAISKSGSGKMFATAGISLPT